MTPVAITAQSESGSIQVFIDHNLVLNGPGTQTISLPEGVLHFLTYFVQGHSGQRFMVGITDPQSIATVRNGVLNATGKETGQLGFVIPNI
jgi:Na+/proline symporter